MIRCARRKIVVIIRRVSHRARILVLYHGAGCSGKTEKSNGALAQVNGKKNVFTYGFIVETMIYT